MVEVIQFEKGETSLRFFCVPDDKQDTLIILLGEQIISLNANDAQRLGQWLSHYRGQFCELTLQMIMQK
jgi:hypothetical protein